MKEEERIGKLKASLESLIEDYLGKDINNYQKLGKDYNNCMELK